MKDNQDFLCASCNHWFEISELSKRVTEPGNYCGECSKTETCACCGEKSERGRIMQDVKNWICETCQYHNDYKDVAQYIKPIQFFKQ